jgi:hypothetical protein
VYKKKFLRRNSKFCNNFKTVHLFFIIVKLLNTKNLNQSIKSIRCTFCEISIEFYSTSTETPFEKTIIINNYFYYYDPLTVRWFLEDFPLSFIFNTAGFVHSVCTLASVISGATRLDSMYSCSGRYSPLQKKEKKSVLCKSESVYHKI